MRSEKRAGEVRTVPSRHSILRQVVDEFAHFPAKRLIFHALVLKLSSTKPLPAERSFFNFRFRAELMTAVTRKTEPFAVIADDFDCQGLSGG